MRLLTHRSIEWQPNFTDTYSSVTDPSNKALAVAQWKSVQRRQQKQKEKEMEKKRKTEMKRREEFELNLRKKQFLRDAAKIERQKPKRRRSPRRSRGSSTSTASTIDTATSTATSTASTAAATVTATTLKERIDGIGSSGSGPSGPSMARSGPSGPDVAGISSPRTPQSVFRGKGRMTRISGKKRKREDDFSTDFKPGRDEIFRQIKVKSRVARPIHRHKRRRSDAMSTASSITSSTTVTPVLDRDSVKKSTFSSASGEIYR